MHPHYFKTGVRRLTKDKLYTFVNTIGLTIGISACLLIWMMAHYELSFDRFHPDRDRIYRAVSRRTFPGMSDWLPLGNISFGAAHAIQKSYPGLDQIASFYSYNVGVAVPAARVHQTPVKFRPDENWDMIVAEPAWFSLFHYNWLAGSPATALNTPYKVVLTAGKAQKYFGSIPFAQMLGKQLIYDDSLPLTVSGIVEDWHQNTDLAFTDFISFQTIGVSFLRNHIGFDDPNQPDSWGERTYAQTFVKLKQGVSPSSFDPFIAGVVKSAAPGFNGGKLQMNLQPLTDLHFDARYWDLYSRKTHLPTLYILMGVAIFLLILAVINFINLSTAQAFARAREIGTRKVLGSGRAGIITQFLTETALMVATAIAFSPFVVWLVFRAFPEFIPPGLAYSELWSGTTLLFLAGTAIVSLLLAGLYPALVLSGLAPALSLKGRITESASRLPRLRQSLTVFQFGIALFFIVATLVVGRQLRYMLHKDLGIRQENIVNIDMWGLNPNLYSDGDRFRLADKIRRIPGVEEVSLNRFSAAAAGDLSGMIKDLTSGIQLALPSRFGDEHYVPIYGLKIIAGRNMQVPKVDTGTEILLSEKAAIELGYRRPEDAIGHRMVAGWLTGPVVGILADYYSESLRQPLKPIYIFATGKDPKDLSVRLTATDGSGRPPNPGTLAALQKAFKEVFPTEDYNYSLFKDEIANQYAEEQRTSTIINVAMGIMILLSCMGLFGLAAFTAGRRTKEIGIRKVLGAGIPGIITLLARQFLGLVMIAFLIAAPIAWYFLHKWLLAYANRIAIQWWEFGLAGVGAIAAALLTVGYHSIRAALVNPVDSLRSE
jgi:putative ABC transport system permease protein